MGNSHNNQPGRLYTSLVDVGNRVHTRNDSDEDVRGNAYKQTIAWKALPWSFHNSNILSAVNIIESFSWVLTLGCICCTCCICCLNNHNPPCLDCNKENNKYNLYNSNNFQIVFNLAFPFFLHDISTEP